MLPRILIFVLAFIATACQRATDNLVLAGSTMGTTFSVQIVDSTRADDVDSLDARIHDRLSTIEKLASTYQDSSEISKFNRLDTTEWVTVAPEFCRMVDMALKAMRDSTGAFDITVGQLVNLWGFGAGARSDVVPDESAIRLAMSGVGIQQLTARCDHNQLRKFESGLQIDLSAWAKGYAVDQISELLSDADINNFIVEIGGEVRASGHRSDGEDFVIAIESPLPAAPDKMPRIRLRDQAVATSGNYRNFFAVDGIDYAHTIDPRTGHPTTHLLAAVTVVHPSAAYADAMATALLVLGPRDGMHLANEIGIAAYFAIRSTDGRSVNYQSSDAFTSSRYLLNQASM